MSLMFLSFSSHAQSILDVATSAPSKGIGSLAGHRSPPSSEREPTPTAPVHFVCNTGYTLKQCHEQMLVLRKALAAYPQAQLEGWTWILVRSEDWKAIVLPRGLDPDSPAFTFLAKRETFIEEVLVTQAPVRSRELLLKWNMSIGALLDFAIRHELSHGLCGDANERHADRMARLLEQKKTIVCEAASSAQSDRSVVTPVAVFRSVPRHAPGWTQDHR